MTKRTSNTGKAVIAGANRRKKKHKPTQPGPIPSGEPPETD